MRISTRIIRTPFGFSNPALASRVYGGDSGWDNAKEKKGDEHKHDVGEAIRHLPGSLLGVTSGYRERIKAPDFDGREAEWWSVIVYDGPPFP